MKDKTGIDITLNYINETFAVLSGGINRRAELRRPRISFDVDTDLENVDRLEAAAKTHVTVLPDSQ